MSSRSPYQIPAPPRVISPSPTPSEASAKDEYFPPTTRSRSGVARVNSTVEPIEEHTDDESHPLTEEDPELSRARPRRRSSQIERRSARPIMTPTNGSITTSSGKAAMGHTTLRKKADMNRIPDGQVNGFLSPNSAYPQGFGAAYWRNLSRSPSPFGLIPIHREWRAFVHKHEVPRKVLHVSIGFIALYLYHQGVQPTQIHPILLAMLVPIFTVDLIRFRWAAFNQLYIKAMGALMRESEAHDRFNGVISYLAGLWATARFCRKDVFVMSVLLLSWCDTAASTFGRLFGKYTPRIRRGKSLAGSLAAFSFGISASVVFWGFIAPSSSGLFDSGINRFAFQGKLVLPALAREWLGVGPQDAAITGTLAVGVLSVVSGLVASMSEAVDIFGLDDNLTIPVLCGLGLGAFLWTFGGQ